MKKRIALVTGGNRGIGAAVVKKFVDEGYFVYFTYNQDKAQAEALFSSFNQNSLSVKALQLSLNSIEQQKDVFDLISKEIGYLNVLVNNAGITRDALLARMSLEDWDEVINTNLRSTFTISKLALDLLLPERNGAIINLSSVSGVKGAVGQCNYAASKGGIIAFTKSLARELSSFNIRVNAVAPGFIETDMTKHITGSDKKRFLQNCLLNRFGRPEEVANAVSFLASEAASYIQGQVIVVDGGVLL